MKSLNLPSNGWFKGLSTVFAPKSQTRAANRDRAFRERVIRSILIITVILGVVSFASTILIFHSPWSLISFPSIHVYAMVLCAFVALALSRGWLVAAGWLLIATVLIGACSIVLLARQDSAINGVFLGFGPFMIVPVVAASVLPRRSILIVGLVSAIVYTLAQFIIYVNEYTVADLNSGQQITNAFIILVIEGLLLQQMRIEFDARLDAMQESMKQTEAAKEVAEDARLRAEKADQAKTQFLAHMSHELRTPLNAIIGYDEAMLAGMAGTFTNKQTDLLGHIQKNSRRLLGLINDVLDLSKIESGNIDVYLSPTSPRKVITDTCESLFSLAQNKNIGLTFEFADNLPEVVLSDARKLEQILVNLIGNAVKFTSEGAVTVKASGVDDRNWQFSVQDSGIGMDPDALKIIFEPFRQVDNSVTRKYKGTGLGLSITKGLVDALGGTIEIETVVGKGSLFRITLPNALKPPSAEDDTPVNK